MLELTEALFDAYEAQDNVKVRYLIRGRWDNFPTCFPSFGMCPWYFILRWSFKCALVGDRELIDGEYWKVYEVPDRLLYEYLYQKATKPDAGKLVQYATYDVIWDECVRDYKIGPDALVNDEYGKRLVFYVELNA